MRIMRHFSVQFSMKLRWLITTLTHAKYYVRACRKANSKNHTLHMSKFLCI